MDRPRPPNVHAMAVRAPITKTAPINPVDSPKVMREKLDSLMDADGSSPFVKRRRTTARQTLEKALYISVDYGTSTIPVACRVYDPQNPASIQDVQSIKFHSSDLIAPQVIGIGRFDYDTQTYKMFWGHEVKPALDKGELKAENIIRLWKLMLYKPFQNSNLVKRLKAQLKSLIIDLVDLIAWHLRRVIEDTKEVIKQSAVMGGSLVDAVDTLETRVFLSVPLMWKDPANRVMREAAKAANIGFVDLVHEPECAAAYYTFRFSKDPQHHWLPGQELIIADVGGGTGDFVTMRYQSVFTDGPKAKLVFGEATGDLCGSALINENLREWLIETVHRVNGRDMTFDDICEELRLTKAAVIEQALRSFEEQKKAFRGDEPRHFSMMIPLAGKAPSNAHDEQPTILLKLQQPLVLGFFNTVVRKIIARISHHRNDLTKAIIIPGGFGRSPYLIAQVRKAFSGITVDAIAPDPQGAHEPVAFGAPLRYEEIRARGLRHGQSFGIAAVEEYQPALHPDADPNGTNPNRAQPSQFYQGLSVYERWTPLVTQAQLANSTATYATGAWQLFTKPVSDFKGKIGHLTFAIYWTELDMQPHAPIRVGDDAHSELIDGIEQWGSWIYVPLPDPKNAGFEEKQSEGSQTGKVYEFWARIAVVGEGANLEARLEIADPKAVIDENGSAIGDELYVIKRESIMICEEEFNPSVRTGN